MEWPLLTVTLGKPEDIVVALHRARQVAALGGLDTAVQTRMAASVSEICRNASAYAGGGRVAFAITRSAPMALCVRVSDDGPGIHDVEAVMDGLIAGQGISAARRRVDEFTIVSQPAWPNGPGGTTVTLAGRLPDGAVTSAADIARIVNGLGSGIAPSPVAELQTQNTELIASLAELCTRQEELVRLNTQLEDTNPGVVALYAELDEWAEAVASGQRTEVTLPGEHEPRIPHAAELYLGVAAVDGSHRRTPGRPSRSLKSPISAGRPKVLLNW